MDNERAFLLKKIAGYRENGLTSLGEFNAKHFEDICKVMLEFATEAMKETVERLNKGEEVNFNGHLISLKKIRQKKQQL